MAGFGKILLIGLAAYGLLMRGDRVAEGARRHLRRLEGEGAVCRVEGQRCLRWLQAFTLN